MPGPSSEAGMGAPAPARGESDDPAPAPEPPLVLGSGGGGSLAPPPELDMAAAPSHPGTSPSAVEWLRVKRVKENLLQNQNLKIDHHNFHFLNSPSAGPRCWAASSKIGNKESSILVVT